MSRINYVIKCFGRMLLLCGLALLIPYAAKAAEIINTIPSSLATVTTQINGNTVTVTVDTTGKTTVGNSRKIKVDGLAITTAAGNTITSSWTATSSGGTCTFTNQNVNVYISFPLYAGDPNFAINTGTAVFRTQIITEQKTYTFESTDPQAAVRSTDPYGYVYYIKPDSTDYTPSYNDDGGTGYNFKLSQTVKANTYCHLGAGYYGSGTSGTIDDMYFGELPLILPNSLNLIYGTGTDTERQLTVNVQVPSGLTASYQWYKNTSSNTSSGDTISGATGNTYIIPKTESQGTKYYYCRVTLTKTGLTTSTFSDVAKVVIAQKEIGLTWTNTDLTYNGTSQKPTATATGLFSNDSCTVSVSGAQTAAGEYTATATSVSNSNYKLPSNKTHSFTISAKTITNPTITLEYTTHVYTGSSLTPTVTVKDGSTEINGEEYSVNYSDNTYIGTANVVISDNLNGNYTVSGNTSFSITQLHINIKAKSQEIRYGESIATGPGQTEPVTLGEGDTLTGITLTTSTNNTTTSGTITPSAAVITKGSTDVTGNYDITYLTGGLTINQSELIIDTAPSATSITYGDALSESQITGSMKDRYTNTAVTGTFSWDNDGIKPTVADSGTTTYAYTFRPSDITNYPIYTGTMTLTINPIEAVLEWSNTELTYNGRAQKPSANVMNRINNDTCNVNVSGEQTFYSATAYTATAESLDNANYTLPADPTTSFTIAQLHINIKAKSQEIRYGENIAIGTGQTEPVTLGEGDTLTGITLTTSTNNTTTSGTITPSAAVITKGSTDVTGNYDITYLTGGLTINQSELIIDTAPSATSITYGDALSESQITGSMKDRYTNTAVTGTFSWDNDGIKPTVADSGTTTYAYTFRPSDITNYPIYTGTMTLTINPKDVMVQAQNKAFIYTGSAQSWPEYDVDGLVGDDAISAVVKGSITYPAESPVDNVVKSYEFTSGTPGNYSIKTEKGQLTMTNASAEITITAASQEWTYDGKAHANSEVTVTSGSLFEGDSLEAEATGSVTDVSDTAARNNPIAAGYKVMHGDQDVTNNYAITAVAGKLTINPKNATVTARDHEFTYTGSAQSWPEYDVEGLVGDDAISAVVMGSITYPGDSPVANKVASYEFTTGTPGNYCMTTKDGQLTMKKAAAEITITAASQEWTYDGEEHTNPTVTLTGGTLFDGDRLAAEATGSVTDVSDTEDGNNPVAAGYKIMHGEQDVTANYVIIAAAGKLTVKPKAVTITARDKAFSYSGEAQSWPEYNVDGLIEPDEIKAVVAGSITYPNESPVANRVESYEFISGVPGNYSVTTRDGQLTMVYASTEITITAASDEWTYNGGSHSNKTVTVTGGELLAGDELVAEATGSVKNVADTAKGNNPVAKGYRVMHGSEDVTGNYAITPVAGTLTVKPKEIKVSGITAKDKEYDGTTEATLVYDRVILSGRLAEDELTVRARGVFEDAKEGTEKKVLISGLKLEGAGAGNYKLADQGQQTETKASILPAAKGTLDVEVVSEPGAPQVENTNLNEVAAAMVTEEEKTRDVKIWMELKLLAETEAPEGDNVALISVVDENGLVAGVWIDLSMFKQVDGGTVLQIHEVPEEVFISVAVPEELKKPGRTYYLYRVHDGETTLIASTTGDVLEGYTKLFSTYLIAYKEAAAPTPTSSPEETATPTPTPTVTPEPTATPKPVPRTGDSGNPALWIALTAIGILLFCAAVIMPGARRKQQ